MGRTRPVIQIVPVRMPTIPGAVKIMICPIGAHQERQHRQTNFRADPGQIDFSVIKGGNQVISAHPASPHIRANIAPLIVLLTTDHLKQGARAQHMHDRKIHVRTGAQIDLGIGKRRVSHRLRRRKHGADGEQTSAGRAEPLLHEALRGGKIFVSAWF